MTKAFKEKIVFVRHCKILTEHLHLRLIQTLKLYDWSDMVWA